MVNRVKPGRIATVQQHEIELRDNDDTFIELRRSRVRAREAVITREEFFRMMQAAKDPKDRIILALAVMGLRASEISAICLGWVDLANKTITIPDSVAKKGHGRTVPYGKFKRLAPLVDAYFLMSDRVGLSRQAVWQRVKHIARRAKLEKPITVHGLRATGATWAASAGLSAQALRELFGWNTLVTAQFYIEKSSGTAAAELEEKGDKIL